MTDGKKNRLKVYGRRALNFAKEAASVVGLGVLQGASFAFGYRWISNRGRGANLKVLNNGQKSPVKLKVAAEA